MAGLECILRTQQRYAVAYAHFLIIWPRMKSLSEEFAAITYGCSTSTNKVNKVLLDIFACKQRPYNRIPPSKAALIEHIKHDIHGGNHYASR